MIRFHGKVEYEGGRVVEFECGAAALAEYELYALRHGYPVGVDRPPMLSALVMIHHALGVDEGFDVWRKSVQTVELEAEGVPPTLQAAITGS